MTTADLVQHFGVGFSIEVSRSNHNDVPMIVFRSINRGLVSALAAHHCVKLNKMQSTWKPWNSGGRADKSTEGLFYSVISLKGLRPSALKAWIDAAKSAGFVVDVADNVFWSQRVTNDLNATTVTAIVHETTVEAEVVEEIPAAAKVTHQINGKPAFPSLNPIQARIASLTVKEMRDYLKANGEKTTGRKAQLQDRMMQTI
jgi:hypothetical protein